MDFFQNLSVKTKLFSGIILIILIFLVLFFWQFNRLDQINKELFIIKKAENSITAIKRLSEINRHEMAIVLELIQSTDNESIKSLYEEYTLTAQDIGTLYDSLFFNVKSIFPDNSNASRIRIVNYLNENRSSINNILIPYFENVHLLKKAQREFGDIFLPEQLKSPVQNSGNETDTVNEASSEELIQVEESMVAGSSRKVQLLKLFTFYKQNHDQINKKYADITKVMHEEFTAAENKINYLTTKIKWNNSLYFFIALLAAAIILWLVSKTIAEPLTELEKLALKLAKGELPEHTFVLSKDEIGKMATALNALTDGLIKTSEFASEIGRGNFASAFEPLSSKDVLGNSLLEMRKSLQAANEDEKKRKIEDQERNWTTEGMARFGEILRRHTENIGLLSKDIIQNLVKYLNANQGGIFILNDSDPENVYLDLMSAYAYNREKFIKKRIQLGEGLVGGAAVEKYTIHMTELPEEYIEIESGLGGANPNSLLIIPLKLEDAVLGVIEIASFNKFKKHEIELVERIGESIASTLSTAKINTRTAELLEQSRIQTQEMQEQDEEMRQNMEEMVAAQEDSLRREEELKKEVEELESMRISFAEKDKKQRQRIDELNKGNTSMTEELELIYSQLNRAFEANMDPAIMIDENRTIQFFNSAAEALFDYSRTEVIGQSLDLLIDKEIATELNENILLYFQTGRKGLIDKERPLNVKNKSGDAIPVTSIMFDLVTRGKRNITMLFKNLGTIRQLENERDTIREKLMSKEFDYSTKINFLENFIRSSGQQIPEETEIESDLLTWSEKFSIDLNIIDQQHKKWIEIINILYKSYKLGAKKKELSENISKLLDYTDYHFGFEEKYLEDFKCDSLEEHKIAHAGFISHLKDHLEMHNNDDTEAVYKLIIYLNNWVLDHIQNMDKRYVECFKLNGLQ